MKAIRKLLAMALVVVMVLSMSTFVFATEEDMQPRSCAHNVVHRQVARFEYGDEDSCYMYYDFYEECSECGYVFYKRSTFIKDIEHFLEDGQSFCWQCYHDGCRPKN